MKADRFIGIDITRGLAILFMVFSHGLHWLYTGTSHDIIVVFGSLSLGDAAAAVFFTVAGVSLHLSVFALLRKDNSPTDLLLRYRKRFSRLFFVGACLSLIWGVLQAQALALFILSACFLACFSRFGAARSRLVILLVAFVSLAVHQLLVNFFDYTPLMMFVRGQLPIFAILGMAGAGFFAAVLLNYQERNCYLVLVGSALMAVSLLLHHTDIPIKRFDASPSFVLLGVGLTLVCIGVFNSAVNRALFFCRYLAYVGRDGLFLFVFHYTALFVPVYLLGFYNQLDRAPALTIAALFVMIVFYTAVRRRNSDYTIYCLVDRIFELARETAHQAVYSLKSLSGSPYPLLRSERHGFSFKNSKLPKHND